MISIFLKMRFLLLQIPLGQRHCFLNIQIICVVFNASNNSCWQNKTGLIFYAFAVHLLLSIFARLWIVFFCCCISLWLRSRFARTEFMSCRPLMLPSDFDSILMAPHSNFLLIFVLTLAFALARGARRFRLSLPEPSSAAGGAADSPTPVWLRTFCSSSAYNRRCL